MSVTPEELKPSFPFSLVNRLDKLSQRMIPIDGKRAMKLAERTTGLSDWGGGEFQRRLGTTIEGANVAQSGLTIRISTR